MKFYETKRLILREWLDSDTLLFIALNQDKHVMRFFPSIYTADQTVDYIRIYSEHMIKYGYSNYVCELKDSQKFIGFVGLMDRLDLPFSPCVEIGWRLAKKFWGQGLVVEAALKCLDIGFNEYNIDEIISFTSVVNKPSQRVMQKIGMQHSRDEDFNHPKLAIDHPLCRHVLYRIRNKSVYN